MSARAIIPAIIGLILIAGMIALVVWLQPVRDFPGWWLLLIVVLVVAVGSAVAMRGRG